MTTFSEWQLKESKELTFPALGRAAFLGQLYDASSGRLLNMQLFDDETAEKIDTIRSASTVVKYSDIHSIVDRANALDVKADLSYQLEPIRAINVNLVDKYITILTVTFDYGCLSTHEVSMICTVRKDSKRLKINKDTSISQSLYNRTIKRGATHVITSIVYGGTLIANITEKVSSAVEPTNKVQGVFSASKMQRMSSLFSREGKAAVDRDETSKDIAHSYDFNFYGDYASTKEVNPTTIGDILELGKKWPELVGEGVPVEITATPLTSLTDDPVEAKVLHELGSAEDAAILATYNELYSLATRRSRLLRILESGLSQYCPTLLGKCRQQKSLVDGVFGQSQKDLAKHIITYHDRGAEKVEPTAVFLDRMRTSYKQHLKDCERDESALRLLQKLRALAMSRNVPFVTLAELQDLMILAHQSALGVVLMPSLPIMTRAINTYDVHVKNIRRWRDKEDKDDMEGSPKKTTFVTYYSDKLVNQELLRLDGKTRVLGRALERCEETSDSQFLHYGMRSLHSLQNQFDWSLFNDDNGWALLYNEEESWYYVGRVKEGKRHGRGTITYADGSTYSGDWWKGRRHGHGELIERNSSILGVFIDGCYRSDGVMVDLIVIANYAPIAAYKIPLRKRDGSTSHVLKISNFLGWATEEYKLTLEYSDPRDSPQEVIVVGSLIKQGQDELFDASWLLDKGLVIKAEKLF